MARRAIYGLLGTGVVLAGSARNWFTMAAGVASLLAGSVLLMFFDAEPAQ